MSIFKRLGKILVIFIMGVISLLICVFLIFNEKRPKLEQSAMADQLAEKMLNAIHHKAYINTRYLEWTFAGKNRYRWDKQQQVVDVSWDVYRVVLNIQQPDISTVFLNQNKVKDKTKFNIIEKAIANFNNDSFWLVAPQKIFDPGTERGIVHLKNGEKALLVNYTSGGNTPGDSYVWYLDESGLPLAFKMWVSIIPIGGLKATWDNWQITESGVLLPSNHTLVALDISMGDVKAWND